MAENTLGIGRISFPSNTPIDLLLAMEELVRRADDNINYTLKPHIDTVTANYTATDLDWTIICDTTGGSFTVTLPQASTVKGKQVAIKKIAAGGTLIIDGYSSEEIDGATTDALTSLWESVILHCDGTEWFKIA